MLSSRVVETTASASADWRSLFVSSDVSFGKVSGRKKILYKNPLQSRASERSDTPKCDSDMARKGDKLNPTEKQHRSSPKQEALHLCGITSEIADYCCLFF